VNPKQQDALPKILRARFEEHANRHPGLAWADVEARLRASPAKLTVLEAMEKTGGEPDVIGPAATASDLPRPAPRLALSTRSTLKIRSGQVSEQRRRSSIPSSASCCYAIAITRETLESPLLHRG
jgi:hypothetical protein